MYKRQVDVRAVVADLATIFERHVIQNLVVAMNLVVQEEPKGNPEGSGWPKHHLALSSLKLSG